MRKDKIYLILIIFIILMLIPTISFAYAHVTLHSSSHVSSSKSTTSSSKSSSSSSKSTISGATTSSKTYTKSNINTEKVNDNPTYYHNYSTTTFFTPNIWFWLWAFNNTGSGDNGEVTEQDIAKELEERGYSQEEIQEILQQGKDWQNIDMYALTNCAKDLINKMEER